MGAQEWTLVIVTLFSLLTTSLGVVVMARHNDLREDVKQIREQLDALNQTLIKTLIEHK